jgi:DNA-binding transcriptional MerR regulator
MPMRVAELSRATGVPVATIKYYLREGLLPPGRRTSPNQAQYNETHVRRLKMIRALVDVGLLSVAAAKDVLSAVDRPGEPVHEVLGTAAAGLTTTPPTGSAASRRAARHQVEQLIESRGWTANADAPAGRTLIHAVTTLHELGRADLADLLEPYAAMCAELAEIDVAAVSRGAGAEEVVEGMVIGTVIGEVMLSAVRRLAHQHVAARLRDWRPLAP